MKKRSFAGRMFDVWADSFWIALGMIVVSAVWWLIFLAAFLTAIFNAVNQSF